MRYTFLTLLLFFSTLTHGQTSTTDNLLPSDSLQTDSIIPQPTFQTEADADSTANIDELYGTANKDDAKNRFVYPDTTWQSFTTGSRVHLQRLSLQDTLVITKKNSIKPILESLAINFGVWGYDHFLRDDGWADVTGKTIKHNFKAGWSLDIDSYSGNQFSHPYHGSMFYNAARYHGHNYYVSALYPLIGSCVWEYFCETNEPSYNDFLSTGIGGSAIGEVTHRVSDLVFDNSKRGVERLFRELVGGFINPARGVHRLFSGQMWRVGQNRGKIVEPEPFSLDVGIGNRYMKEMRGQHRQKNVAYVDFLMNYGQHYDGKDSHKPFDYFRLYALLNISGNDPTFSHIDIKGRIATKQFSTSKNWQYDLGFYQVYKYIDNYGDNKTQRPGNYALLNEACSFAGGLYVEKTGRKLSFSNDFMVDGVGFGGTTSDYYKPRRYNYASGFSFRNDTRLCVNHILAVGNDLYFARMFVFKGTKKGDMEEANPYFWGDKGNNSILMNRAYLNINLKYNIKLNVEHILYYRRSNYDQYPHVRAKSYEMKLGLIYSI